MIVVTVNNMKFDLLFCVGVCGKIVYNPVFDSKIVKKVQQTAWLSHCWTFSSFGGCVMFVFYNPFDFLAIPFRFLSVIY